MSTAKGLSGSLSVYHFMIQTKPNLLLFLKNCVIRVVFVPCNFTVAELGRSSRNHKAHKIEYVLHLVIEKNCLSLVQFLIDRKEGRDCVQYFLRTLCLQRNFITDRQLKVF